jgi:hypothetical protein
MNGVNSSLHDIRKGCGASHDLKHEMWVIFLPLEIGSEVACSITKPSDQGDHCHRKVGQPEKDDDVINDRIIIQLFRPAKIDNEPVMRNLLDI